MGLRINQDVLEVLDKSEIDGNKLMLGGGQLDRKLYTDVNKVLVAIGGKWNRGAKAHLFDGDVSEVLEPILETGEYSRTKQDFGQFDTPAGVVDLVIRLADIEQDMDVLEPSAGIGNIATAASMAGGAVIAYEIDRKRCDQLVSAIRGLHHLNMVMELDFLSVEPRQSYDRVVMNPPFAKQVDIKHVLHAMKFLKSDGRLVSVMSAGVLYRDNKLTKDFRQFVTDQGGHFAELPEKAFAESGTNIRTCIVVIPA